MKISNCCGAYPVSYSDESGAGDMNTEDFGICPDCKEHCEYIEEPTEFDLFLEDVQIAAKNNSVAIPDRLSKVLENLYDLGHSAKSAIAYLLVYRKNDLINL